MGAAAVGRRAVGDNSPLPPKPGPLWATLGHAGLDGGHLGSAGLGETGFTVELFIGMFTVVLSILLFEDVRILLVFTVAFILLLVTIVLVLTLFTVVVNIYCFLMY